MPTKAQTQFQPPPEPPRKHDLAHRANEDVSGPLTVILAVIAFVLLASFVYSLDWRYSPDLPAVTQTLPSTAPATPPSTPPSNS